MSIQSQFEREEDRLWKAYVRGDISPADYNAEMQQLQRDARDAYDEAEREAFERVRAEWGW